MFIIDKFYVVTTTILFVQENYIDLHRMFISSSPKGHKVIHPEGA